MSVFSRLAEYYDLIYADKDYEAEVEFVLDKVHLPHREGLSLLELGCGTGRHAIDFFNRGVSVAGIDLSEQMIEIARNRVANAVSAEAARQFEVGDIREVNLGRQFDVVTSLFHVFSYQTTNSDLAAAFRTAKRHLADGGRLFFDFWYGPAVLSDPPKVRVRRLKGSDFSVLRVAEPEHDPNANTVDVHYELRFDSENAHDASSNSDEGSRFEETHKMRYLFLPEIEFYLDSVGLALTDSGKWLSDDPLGSNTWYGWVVAKNKPR